VLRATPWQEAIALIMQAAGLSRPASHGLLIAKDHYQRVARRDPAAQEPEADVIGHLVRRLGRRRVATLRCGAVVAAGGLG